MKSIFDYKLDDLIDYFSSIGQAAYKAKQVFDWIYKKRVFDFNLMTNLSNELRESLKSNLDISLLTLKKKQTSESANKYLFEMDDGNLIEAVLMRHDYGNSVCVSSQVGCNMGCSFCESGRLRKVRNLEPGEIVRQILMIEDDIKERISSVVVMGIGEPFDNYDNIMKFVKIINDPKGLAIGSRHITISTCGVVPKIYEFSKEPFQVNLAISLHAPTNELRTKIMPINKAYNIETLIKAVKDYITITNRRVTFEYILLDNVNDKDIDAKNLAKLLKGINCYVNLIPYNESSNFTLKRSKTSQINRFYDILKKEGINVTIRKEFGSNISAACGQLRSKEEEQK